MKKLISIQISRENLMSMLKERGIEIPPSANIRHLDYDNDFPLVIEWEESALSPLVTWKPNPDHPFLHPFIVPTWSGGFMIPTQHRISAIKAVRAEMGLQLKEAKDWLDKHYPLR